MAKAKTLFHASGKLGPLVYYERYGKQFVRTAPSLKSKRVRKKRETEAQKMARKRFGIGIKAAQKITDVIAESYIEFKKEGSPFHKAAGHIATLATKGNTLETLQVDFSRMPVSNGSLVSLVDWTAQLVEREHEKIIQLTWNPEFGDENDTISFLHIWVTPHEIAYELVPQIHYNVTHTQVKRKEGKCDISIVGLDGNILMYLPLFLYVYFRNETKQRNSPSNCVYMLEGAKKEL